MYLQVGIYLLYIFTGRNISPLYIYREEYIYFIYLQRGIYLLSIFTGRNISTLYIYRKEYIYFIQLQGGKYLLYICIQGGMYFLYIFTGRNISPSWKLQTPSREISMRTLGLILSQVNNNCNNNDTWLNIISG